MLILAGAPSWFLWVAGLFSAGALGAFALSRTVGLAGFVEKGWAPAPYALVSAVAEIAAVLAVAAWAVQASRQRSTPRA